MKKFVWLLSILYVMTGISGCKGLETAADPDYDDNATIQWHLREVLQYDPININGINLIEEFDFFSTLGFTIYRTDGKFTEIEFDNGNIPFYPFNFTIPEGKVACELNTDVSPYELRLKDTGDVVAYFSNGEFYIPFVLDCVELSYKYRFGEVK